MTTRDKPLVWLHGEVKSPPLSKAGRMELGFLLRKLQRGQLLGLPHSRPMPRVGRHCIWRSFRKRPPVRRSQSFPHASREQGYMTMNPTKAAALKSKGWQIGDAQAFLQLTDAETAYVELRLKLADALREARRQLGVSQTKLAQGISSSQSRVAKMEAADPTVSLDLLIRSLLALGLGHKELAHIVAGAAE